jgi:hypothetical protein
MPRILLAHAEDEEDLAETVAGPLRAVGYEVIYQGSLLVGESLVERTYSEIVWLGASWTAPTRADANRTTGLPNSYRRTGVSSDTGRKPGRPVRDD